MQRLLDTGAIVVAEIGEVRTDVGEILGRDHVIGEIHEVVRKARFGRTAEIENDFYQVFEVGESNERLADRQWEDVEELG